MIELISVDSRVINPGGLVYSTAPEVATGPDGKTYFVKGWDSEVAFMEVAGCLLAAEVGLLVPRAEVCAFDGRCCAGVEEVGHAIRSIAPWLPKPEKVTNYGDLFSVIAADTWLANDDRNMGNLVGAPNGSGKISLWMIDFEKSKTLGPHPTISSATILPKRLWPTGELGTFLRAKKPPVLPTAVVQRIGGLSRERIDELLRPVAAELHVVTWLESSVDVLFSRGQRIRDLLEEVWQVN